MKNILVPFAVLAVIFLSRHSYCEDRPARDPEDVIREWTGDDSSAAEFFYDLLIYPMNLATAPARSLGQFPVLDRKDAGRIVDYRETHPFRDILELTNAGISTGTLDEIRPFVIVRQDSNRVRLTITAGYSLKDHVDLSNRITNNTAKEYNGLCRARLEAGYWTGGCVYGWDPTGGLPASSDFQTNARYFLKYDSGAILFMGGHFRAEIGQGLLFGSPLSFPVQGIGREPVRISASGVGPYTSLSGDADGDGRRDFFSGAAARLKFPRAEFVKPQVTLMASDSPDGSDTAANVEVELPWEHSSFGLTASSRNEIGTPRNPAAAYSGYADLSFADFITLAGEYAWSQAQAFRACAVVTGNKWSASALFYAADTNFSAPHGSPLLHRSKDALGGFLGVSAGSPSLGTEIWADLCTRATNSSVDHRYQVRMFWGWRSAGWMSGAGMEGGSKYSFLDDGETLRSGLTVSLSFWTDRIIVTGKWRNLLHFSKKEMGNLFSFRLKFAPDPSFQLSGRWSSYRAAGYDTALYLSGETADPTEFCLKSYYGIGSALDLVLKWNISGSFTATARYSQDDRELEFRTGVSDRSFSVYLILDL